jgi:hypothetical protein
VTSNASGRGGSAKRPWLAVVLAIVYPGLGHLYLREWIRAILWFGLILSASAFLLPAEAVPQSFSLEAMRTATRSLPVEVSLAILAVSALSVADAYWLATRQPQASAPAGTTTCPNCGEELDEDLDFCHWCTTRLDEPGEEGTA